MSFASQTNILAVLSRSDLTRRRGGIHLIKINYIEEVYEQLSPGRLSFGNKKTELQTIEES